MYYAVTFEDAYGRVSVAIDAPTQEQAIKQAMERDIQIKAYHSVQATLLILTKEQADLLTLKTEA